MSKKKTTTKSQEHPSIFSAGPDSFITACLGSRWDDNWYGYIKGYERGSEMLLRQIVDNINMYRDTLVYPIIFMKRQQLELLLKLLIDKACLFLDKEQRFKPTHNLPPLWQDAKKLVEEAFKDEHQRFEETFDLTVTKRVIDDFFEHDRQSVAFRYPENRDRGKTLEGLTHIDLLNFYNMADEVCRMLDCLASELKRRLDWISEMKRNPDY